MSPQQAFGVVVRGLGLYVVWTGCGYLFSLSFAQEPSERQAYVVLFLCHSILGLVLLFEADNFVKLFYREKKSTSETDPSPEDQPSRMESTDNT